MKNLVDKLPFGNGGLSIRNRKIMLDICNPHSALRKTIVIIK
jgi:hypothetical protein